MRTSIRTMMLAAMLVAMGGAAVADDDAKKVDLKVGDTAPAFQSTDDQGATWKSSDHLGTKYIVVYFYPGDFTPGCTAQAQKFRDNLNKLYDQGAEVIGISGDSAKTHALFKQAYKLNFRRIVET